MKYIIKHYNLPDIDSFTEEQLRIYVARNLGNCKAIYLSNGNIPIAFISNDKADTLADELVSLANESIA